MTTRTKAKPVPTTQAGIDAENGGVCTCGHVRADHEFTTFEDDSTTWVRCENDGCTCSAFVGVIDDPQVAQRGSHVTGYMQAIEARTSGERSFDASRFPELAAMLSIHEALDGQTPGTCARVLGAASLLTCPKAFTDEQWLAILRQAQEP